jgi:hypothetical protein
VVVQGFAPSQFAGNTDAFTDMGTQTTTNYQTQSDALKDMIGSPLQAVTYNYIALDAAGNLPQNIPINLVNGPVGDPDGYPTGPTIFTSANNVLVTKYQRGQNGFIYSIVPAINGQQGCVSLKSSEGPLFLRHAGFKLYLHPNGGDYLFAMDSSFKPVRALNGKSYMVSFQSTNYPDRYITTIPGDSGVYLRIIDPVYGAVSDKERGSWLIRKSS